MKIKPFSKKQLKVLTWWKHPTVSQKYSAVIADGSIRSGKTMSMSLSFVIWAMTVFDGMNFAFCGKTVGSCQRNVIKPLLPMLNGLYSVKEKRSDNLVIVSKGKRKNYFYIFGGKDESSQDLIQGITLAGVMLDEVALMPRSFVEQALGRCSVTGSRYWFNCNPDNPYHWFYQEWILQADQKRALYLHFTMDDNLTLSEAKKKEYHTIYSGNYLARYVLGQWVAAEGLIYPNFDKSTCVVPAVNRPYARYYISVDYGTLNPFSAGLWGQYGGVWYRIKELYYDGRKQRKQKTDSEYYSDLVEFIGSLPIQAIIVDPSAASFIAEIQKHGRYVVRKAKNDVLDGIRYTSVCLQKHTILFNDCCENSFREFASYVWDTEASQKTGIDTVLKQFDHAMDDIRYFCYTILKSEDGMPSVLNFGR
jgi:PBSX family phage terminase large subunit